MKNNEVRIVIPAGKYYIGDPSYVFSEKEWSSLIDKNTDPIWNFNDKKFIIVSVGSDGEYVDNDDNSYLVDSGSLGIVPVEIINVEKDHYINNGRIVTFEYPVLFTYFNEEVFAIDDIVIPINTEEEYVISSDVPQGKKYWEVF